MCVCVPCVCVCVRECVCVCVCSIYPVKIIINITGILTAFCHTSQKLVYFAVGIYNSWDSAKSNVQNVGADAFHSARDRTKGSYTVFLQLDYLPSILQNVRLLPTSVFDLLFLSRLSSRLVIPAFVA